MFVLVVGRYTIFDLDYYVEYINPFHSEFRE